MLADGDVTRARRIFARGSKDPSSRPVRTTTYETYEAILRVDVYPRIGALSRRYL
ncbi:MAG: hypothetical protein M3N13_01260 [Candidatus Eremiobacteraeota bacterium]|nr:hypothetical protein [Candidatus Eremiobacteraeota bacterium]